jgi:hypothetical protein
MTKTRLALLRLATLAIHLPPPVARPSFSVICSAGTIKPQNLPALLHRIQSREMSPKSP